MIVAERKGTSYGGDRIALLIQGKGVEVKPSTVRYVLKRYKLSIKHKVPPIDAGTVSMI